MSLLDNFARVTKRDPCPRCDKHDWCMIGKPGTEFDGATLCTRVESAHRFSQAGWLHRPNGRYGQRSRPKPRVLPLTRVTPANEAMARIASDAEESFGDLARARLCAHVHLSPGNLRRLGVGVISFEIAEREGVSWAQCLWTFPMRNARGEITGVRLRKWDGTKLTWPGGREGLFIPAEIDPSQEILLPEGATDTAAALDLGLHAIGRPSCSGGRREVIEYVRMHKPTRVVVVADQDSPGRAGAAELARTLVPHVPDVRQISPPDGIKDLRAWLIAGATPEDLRTTIDATEPLRISFRRREGGAA